MTSEVPYKINVSAEQLALLKAKLELAVMPDELEDVGWDYGAPLDDITRLTKHWKSDFDWRKHETAFNNALPQFTRDIEVEGHGKLNIHYVHQQSDVQGAIPLLFVHGWPGSVLEVLKVLPLLTKKSSAMPSFHVVAYSLPGFGFSEGARKKGFGVQKMAEVGHKLMLALGYDQYVVQGGDWGFWITQRIASDYGVKHCMAWHTNMPCPDFTRTKVTSLPVSEEEQPGLQRTLEIDRTGRAYGSIQETKPQTIGYALADSPVGLLAWIYEKLVAWADAYPWTDDEVLTWVSMYWFSRAGPAASVRIYRESVYPTREIPPDPAHAPSIPMGMSSFPGDIYAYPKSWKHTLGNVVFEAEHKSGGHFAAYERPQTLVGDLQAMFGKGGPAYAVVLGKDGY
ncbi:Alpha/Beta hydrolase protein [Schizophyllum amplum]|uniref:Alpha/Beta hydrolase protein n=1 Tax=Schizophyllum amplum TaxID=97359 RepID=A0A550C6V7_9AGAR|nr:Alpha/Beta hydrolase protein [Auriculariopsis ampla]